MTKSRHLRAGELFAEALDQPIDERIAFVHEKTPDDPFLREEVLSLLAFHDGAEEPAAEPAPKLASGQMVVGRYRLEAPIGAGGMGEVWRATDTLLGEIVAIKSIRRSVAAGPLDEIRLARRVTHPNICRVHDVVSEARQTFLTMEWIEGEDLGRRLIRAGRIPPGEAIDLIAKAAAGLAAAHAAGVYHRDLKPANILLGKDGRVCLTDFGLAQVAGKSAFGPLLGTPAYMAPELLAGQPASERSEVFSLATVLYEAVAGRLPIEESPLSVRVERLRSGDYPLLSSLVSEVSPRLDRAVTRALSADPADRFASILEFAGSLPGCDPFRIAAVAGVAPPVALVAAARRSDRLTRPKIAALAAGIIVSLVAFIFLRVSSPPLSIPPLPPAALVVRAETVIAEMGHRVPAGDREWGFGNNPRHLVPGDVLFWYRRWDRPAVANEISGHGRIEENTPPLLSPGDLLLTLAPDGRLLELHTIARGEDRAENASLTQAARQLAPAGAGIEIRAGAVTKIELPRTDPPASNRPTSTGRILSWIYSWFLPLVSVPLGLFNLQKGRGHVRGAFRAALVLGAIRFLGGLACAHHSGDLAGELQVLRISLSDAMFEGALAAFALLAVEPLARRYWPESVVAANRLLEGRFRDPLVGVSLAAGVFAGLVWAVVTAVDETLVRIPAEHPDWFALDLAALPLHMASNLLERIPGSVGAGLFALLVVVFLRGLFRSVSLAAIAAVFVLAGPSLRSLSPSSPSFWLVAAGWSASMLVLVRAGLVAWIVALLIRSTHLDFPVPETLTAWWTGPSFVAPILALVVGAIGLALAGGWFVKETGKEAPS